MTCIVGVIEDGDVWMGGDSATVAGYYLDRRADKKVFKNGPCLMGFTTSWRMGQLLRYSLKVPDQPNEMDEYEFMVTKFIDAVRKCLHEGGYAKKKDEVEEGGTFLVGYRGKLYQIQDDFQVGQSQAHFDSVGCGFQVAQGALYAIETQSSWMKPLAYSAEAKVTIALEAAERFSAGVRAPFDVISTKT